MYIKEKIYNQTANTHIHWDTQKQRENIIANREDIIKHYYYVYNTNTNITQAHITRKDTYGCFIKFMYRGIPTTHVFMILLYNFNKRWAFMGMAGGCVGVLHTLYTNVKR